MVINLSLSKKWSRLVGSKVEEDWNFTFQSYCSDETCSFVQVPRISLHDLDLGWVWSCLVISFPFNLTQAIACHVEPVNLLVYWEASLNDIQRIKKVDTSWTVYGEATRLYKLWSLGTAQIRCVNIKRPVQVFEQLCPKPINCHAAAWARWVLAWVVCVVWVVDRDRLWAGLRKGQKEWCWSCTGAARYSTIHIAPYGWTEAKHAQIRISARILARVTYR